MLHSLVQSVQSCRGVSSSFTLITTGRIETHQDATYSIWTLMKIDYWSPEHVELLNVTNKNIKYCASRWITHTHTHTHIYIYIYIYYKAKKLGYFVPIIVFVENPATKGVTHHPHSAETRWSSFHFKVAIFTEAIFIRFIFSSYIRRKLKQLWFSQAARCWHYALQVKFAAANMNLTAGGKKRPFRTRSKKK